MFFTFELNFRKEKKSNTTNFYAYQERSKLINLRSCKKLFGTDA